MKRVLETFRCVPLKCTITREQCGARHARQKAGIGAHGRQSSAEKRRPCAACEVGAAHQRNEEPSTWPDGAPIELVDMPLPEPGERRLLGGGEEKPAARPGSADAPARVPSTPPEPRASTPAPRALARPKEPAMPKSNAKPITYQGETKSVAEWARDERCVVNPDTLYYRVRKGWPIEPALTTKAGGGRPKKRKPKAVRVPKSSTATSTPRTSPKHAPVTVDVTNDALGVEIARREQELATLKAAANLLAAGRGEPAPYPEADA